MLLPSFTFSSARSVEEALELWAHLPGAAYLAGGTDLLPQLRMGKRTHRNLIDIKRIASLSEIRETDAGLAIGAAVPLADIARHRTVRQHYPLLAECCRRVGAWPLQNRATLAGNICNASPAADTAVALLALEADIIVVRPGDERTLPVTGLFRGPGQTCLEPGDLVAEVVLPRASAGWHGSYERLSRRQGMDLATVGVLVACSNGGSPPRHRVALAAVAPTPLRVADVEALLDREGPRAARRAGELARDCCRPITDLRGSAEYRREMVGVLVARAVVALNGGPK
ncbi:MAG TPA: xanthine dehydrogenase family protein subunit M [Thermoanaerobaculaceae bacterium]|nr:xanthine dehydrogenase family protein subunit M [Thermoanaerobaculaceae bacterium]HPS76739.1 xanthine dehydrogenase family protein subunit M [Thermoanaerobaculaceae bacterium]